MGPWTGQLGNGGERLRLYNNDNRVLNQVDYNDSGDWPTAPDGTGVTLAKSRQQTDSEDWQNWTFSEQLGGTPGGPNFLEPGLYLSTELDRVAGTGAGPLFPPTTACRRLGLKSTSTIPRG